MTKLTQDEKDEIINRIWEAYDFDCNHDVSVLMNHTFDQLQTDTKLQRWPWPFREDMFKWDDPRPTFKMCQSITRKLQDD